MLSKPHYRVLVIPEVCMKPSGDDHYKKWRLKVQRSAAFRLYIRRFRWNSQKDSPIAWAQARNSQILYCVKISHAGQRTTVQGSKI